MFKVSSQEELNNICLEMLEIVADLDEKKREQARYLQDGHLCLAKARYSMGVDRVSSLQYPTDMEPSLLVHIKDVGAEDCFSVIKSNAEECKTDDNSETKAIRRKNADTKTINESDVIGKMNELNLSKSTFVEDVKSKKVNVDPLTWFGVLVPLPLKQAQIQFNKAAQVSCEISNLRLKFYNAEMKLNICKTALKKNKKCIDDDNTN